MAISEFRGLNLAVPGTALLKPGESGKLAFDASHWLHLNRYIGLIERLPEAVEGCSAKTATALDRLRSAARDFGSPRRLRQLVLERPNALAEAQPPPTLYARIVWLIQHLHESAGSVVSTLQTMAAAAKSTDDMKQGLQLLGRKAEDIRGSIGAAIDALGDFKRTMLTASSALSEAFKADAAQLHKLQEEVGGLRYRAESLSKEIEETGFFGARKKRELEAELQSVRQELEAKSGQADKLRAAVGKIEPILGEATWVEPSLDDLIGFLDKSRTVWTAFGSSLAQLVADASQDQLAEPAWMKRALGFDEAISQWQAIDRAAAEFTENALVDID